MITRRSSATQCDMEERIKLNDPTKAQNRVTDAAVLLRSFRELTEQALKDIADLRPLIERAKQALAGELQCLSQELDAYRGSGGDYYAMLKRKQDELDRKIRSIHACEEDEVAIRREAAELLQRCEKQEADTKTLAKKAVAIIQAIEALK